VLFLGRRHCVKYLSVLLFVFTFMYLMLKGLLR
jgi:hypothetical protein